MSSTVREQNFEKNLQENHEIENYGKICLKGNCFLTLFPGGCLFTEE